MEAQGGFPPELRAYRPAIEAYANAKLQRFAVAFGQRINPQLTAQQIQYLARETIQELSQQAQAQEAPQPAPAQAMPQMQPPMPQMQLQLPQQQPQQQHHQPHMQQHLQMPHQNLRLVLRHDCQSSGCGDVSCALCQYNPSRICKRNLKSKYLIDDHLRAKCGAGLRVEVVDEAGQCCEEGLPDVQLEVHVLNGEKYKEVCPDNTLLNTMQLRACIIAPNQKKPLLKRDGGVGVTEDNRIFLMPDNGQAPLSELQCTTSSEALLCGKAPTFRLLVWATDMHGNHLQNVTYVVSENFVVATKRVKHAIKSDIPSVADHISKLVHIGKATVDKLIDLRTAATEENLEVDIPDELNCVEKVGQFQHLVEQAEQSSDLKHKLRHLLKLSPEKWDEVAQHAMAAVVPDFRPRVWWCASIGGGLLFSCKNGAIIMEHPAALVTRGTGDGAEEGVVPIQQLDASVFNLLPKLKQQALQDWYAPGHPGWAVYWKDPNDPLAQQMQPGIGAQMPPGIVGAGNAGGLVPSSPLVRDGYANDQKRQRSGGGGAGSSIAIKPGSSPVLNGGLHGMQQPQPPGAGAEMSYTGALHAATGQQQQGQQQQRQARGSGGGGTPGSAGSFGTGRSPFAVEGLQNTVSDAFPAWMVPQGAAARAPGDVLPARGPGDASAAHAAVRSAGGMPPPPGSEADARAGAAAAAAAAAAGLGTSGLHAMIPSLEMINTDDLPAMDRGGSLWSLDSLQQLQMLGDHPSGGVNQLLGNLGGDHSLGGSTQGVVAMMMMQQQHQAAQQQHGQQHHGQQGQAAQQQGQQPMLGPGGDSLTMATGGMDRALSLKFSMSLDLADVPELKT